MHERLFILEPIVKYAPDDDSFIVEKIGSYPRNLNLNIPKSSLIT